VKSRVFGIKKINILKSIVIINAVLFVVSIFVSIFVLKNPKIWFYFFCTFVGFYLLVKSYLYKNDSNCYLGFLLLFVGFLLCFNEFFLIIEEGYMILFSFISASFMTFVFYQQKFHLFLSIILFLILGLLYMLGQNIINIYIFFGLISLIIFLFLFIYVKIKIRKKL
jgi:hypothetical protein